jgi:hypothetical protein
MLPSHANDIAATLLEQQSQRQPGAGVDGMPGLELCDLSLAPSVMTLALARYRFTPMVGLLSIISRATA